ncbi:PASTA domain-containing protein [Nocardia sp. NPDC051052]|uniref:PASTA domain-containing protein n=1 Tax=Nocardia sp. NPDC051052 TaxID=3364322 RepID=UPI0037912B90
MLIAGICGLVMVAVSGCGAETDRGKAVIASATTSVAAPVSSAAVTSPVIPKTTVRQEVPTPPPAPVQRAPTAQALMPNVVCMNLQAAQNKIQEGGVWYSRSTDATGKGRMQVLDANWIVVAQTPAPGVPIGEGDAVLSVVKIGERNPC